MKWTLPGDNCRLTAFMHFNFNFNYIDCISKVNSIETERFDGEYGKL